ncbi:MAG: ABC transporter ATP-binding protein [Pseudomonadota bacterium]
MADALEFDAIRKSYGRLDALRSVSFRVGAGRSIALVGVNGAGKTTLLKSLLDFCAIDGGTIRIFGEDHRRPESRSRLAFLPERFTPPYYLSGREFLNLVLTLQRHPYDDGEAAAVLAELDLDPAALDRPARSLSKGMTQKLGLSACFLAGKDLLVLDEPMSGLDPKARVLVKHVLERLRREGRTLFFTTHALADVEEVCDEMVILHAGQVRFAGDAAALRARHGGCDLESAFLQSIGEPAPARGGRTGGAYTVY